MTAGEMIKALQAGIRKGTFSRDDKLTLALSSNGRTTNGQIDIEYVSGSITSPAGYFKGPILEVKGRVRCV